MRLSAAVDALAADLGRLGALGDEATAETARRLADAMEGPLTARLIETIGQIAAEVSATLTSGRVEVRIIGGDATLVVVDDDQERPSAPAEAEAEGDSSARITLRLSPQLKVRIEAASAREGVSVNTYVVRALGEQSRAPRRPTVGRHLTGYGRS